MPIKAMWVDEETNQFIFETKVTPEELLLSNSIEDILEDRIHERYKGELDKFHFAGFKVV